MKKSIKSKAAAAVFTVLLLSIPFFILLNYILIQVVLPYKSETLYQTYTSRIENHILFLLQASDYTYQQMISDSELINALKDETSTENIDIICSKTIAFSKINNQYVSDVALITPNNIYFSSTRCFLDIESSDQFIENIFSHQSSVSLLQLNEQSTGLSSSPKYLNGKIGVLRPLTDTKEQQAYALILLNDINVQQFQQLSYLSVADSTGHQFFLQDQDGIDQDIKLDTQNSSIIQIKNKFYLINSTQIELYNWKIVMAIPILWYKNLLIKSLLTTTIAAILIIFLIMILSYKLFDKMNAKISQIVKYFSKIDNQQTPKITIKHKTKTLGYSNRLKLTFLTIISIYQIIVCSFSYIFTESQLNWQNQQIISAIHQLDIQIIDNFIYNYNEVIKFITNQEYTKKFFYQNLSGEDIEKENYRELSLSIINTVSNIKNYPMGIRLLNLNQELLFQGTNITDIPRPDDISFSVYPIWRNINNEYFYIALHCYEYEKVGMSLGECNIIVPTNNLYQQLPTFNSGLQYKIVPLSTPAATNNLSFTIPFKERNFQIEMTYKDHQQDKVKLIFLIAYVMFSLFILLIILQISNLVSKHITNPIHQINQVLSANLKNIPPKYNQYHGDELDILIDGYNSMVDRLDQLIDEICKRKIKEEQLEFDILLSQINPHFLYSTLETINSMIDINDPRTTKMIHLLSQFFRKGISNPSSIVSLKEELEYTRIYCDILKIRFGDQYQFLFPDQETMNQLDSVYTIRLIVQPLVENCIKHGFRKKYQGTITISVDTAQDIQIRITDDGDGFSPEQLQTIRNQMTKLEDADGIGIQNINRRIKMKYGSQYGITIESQQSVFSTVTIHIPKNNQ